MEEKAADEPKTLDLTKLAPIIHARKSKLPFALDQKMPKAVVFSRHRFYRQLVVELIAAETTKSGNLKNPLSVLDPLSLMWQTEDQAKLKFLAGISHFRNNYNEGREASDFNALKAIIQNPFQLNFYVHDDQNSAVVQAKTVRPVSVTILKPDIVLNVDERNDNFAVTGTLHIKGRSYALEEVKLRYHYFIEIKDQLFLVDDPFFLSVIDFFVAHRNHLVMEREAYESFETNILSLIEEKVKINYAFLKRATPKQLTEHGFDLENEQLLYLSESEDYVLLTPVMRYGSLEVPIISQKQIRAKDKRGKFFTLARDEARELQFVTTIAKMHPYLMEQLLEFPEQRHADCFYIHRKHFLDPDWFLNAFEYWRNRGIAILGFNELKNNKLSAYKAEIAIHVVSGIDWFETAIKVKFNKEVVSVKHLHKSIRNKNKFVVLDDGSIGILPNEWLQKFEAYFGAGEVVNQTLRMPPTQFTLIEELYAEHWLSTEAKQRIALYKHKLLSFGSISSVVVSKDLQATLRDYQKEGLNWLNFLDEFNFGGCLADDMGLGKTIQVLAFVLSQREKVKQNTNLIVVPASLIFNWQQEIKKFAPSLKVKVIYGADRERILASFDDAEVVLTSYGTLLADIRWLKNYLFNYIFLDESQYIKNPDSQRYKAVRLLQSRNKIVLTGTPIENNTFDLYAQLSFACPGLLGNRDHFKRLYSVPIDQFKDSKAAATLQKRIHPFILRRTKEQVAKELPAKTEMVIYCEMGKQQRELYESSREEIRDYLMGKSEDELTKSSMHVLKGITKLRQICNSPELVSKEKYYGNASAKIDVLMEQIESKSPQHQILVFSQFVGMLNLVKAELESRAIPFSYLTGDTKNRASVVSSFQDHTQNRVFLISLKAGGVGLNLTAADYVYVIDPWWNPAVENQAIDRAYRIGQHKNVVAVRLICPDTIEEKMMQMQEGKKDLAAHLIQAETSFFKSLTKNDLLNLL